MRIGFIGLGIMGKPMAKNLLKAGYDVTVSKASPAAPELLSAGARGADLPELGRECDLVLTMVPNGPQVKAVMLGETGVAASMRPGSTFIDMSSIDPTDSREIAGELEARGIEMLDAPVSGGEPKAVEGTLAFMVGGKAEVFRRCEGVLRAMGSSVVHCGAVGAGNTAKLANQIIVACNIQALAEALTLAERAGADPEVVFQAIRGGLAGSAVMEAKAPMMLSGRDQPGFKVDLHIKDLDNALSCGRAAGTPLPMTEAARGVLQWLHESGFGQDDHSSMIKYYRGLAGPQPPEQSAEKP